MKRAKASGVDWGSYEEMSFIFFRNVAVLCMRDDIRQGKLLRFARFCRFQQHCKNSLYKPDSPFRRNANIVSRERKTERRRSVASLLRDFRERAMLRHLPQLHLYGMPRNDSAIQALSRRPL